MRANGKANILFLDIENAPNVGYTWRTFEQNVIEFVEPWYILSFAYKWLGEKETYVEAIPDFIGYKPCAGRDYMLVKHLWTLLNQADVVVAHNGDAFDIPKINARFLHHHLPPPAPYKTIDTLKATRRRFWFNAYNLDKIGATLGVGRKVKHIGFPIWLGCMRGERKAWKVMRRYNKRDVDLLYRIYMRIRPWIKNHPDVSAPDKPNRCNKCNSSHLQSRGRIYSKSRWYHRMQCMGCGAWIKGTIGDLVGKTKRNTAAED